jgi:hypothetical protein
MIPMKRNTRRLLAVLLTASLLVISLGSAGAAPPYPLTPEQERAATGGDLCSFAAGLAVGLDIGGLFGCLPCAFAGSLVGLAAVVYCS